MTLTELYDVAEKENIIVSTISIESDVSFSLPLNRKYSSIAIDPSQLENETQEKECLSHELGHCITGSFYNKYSRLDSIERIENKANCWAIKKLVPLAELVNALETGTTEIWELSELFDVTEPFMRKALAYYHYL